MALHDDGDVIRGVGFVAIYAAYVEEALDSLLECLNRVKAVDDQLRRRQTSRKIREIKKRLQILDRDGFEELLNDIDQCVELLEARHEIIHGRIYGQTEGPDMLNPARPDKARRPVSSIELYELANQLNVCRSMLIRPQIVEIPGKVADWIAT